MKYKAALRRPSIRPSIYVEFLQKIKKLKIKTYKRNIRLAKGGAGGAGQNENERNRVTYLRDRLLTIQNRQNPVPVSR